MRSSRSESPENIVRFINGGFPVLVAVSHVRDAGKAGSLSLGGGERAPGMGTGLPITAVDRHRPGDAYFGTYYLLSGTR